MNARSYIHINTRTYIQLICNYVRYKYICLVTIIVSLAKNIDKVFFFIFLAIQQKIINYFFIIKLLTFNSSPY